MITIRIANNVLCWLHIFTFWSYFVIFNSFPPSMRRWTGSALVHYKYLNQCRFIVMWTFRYKLQWNRIKIYNFYALKCIWNVCEIGAILSRGRWGVDFVMTCIPAMSCCEHSPTSIPLKLPRLTVPSVNYWCIARTNFAPRVSQISNAAVRVLDKSLNRYNNSKRWCFFNVLLRHLCSTICLHAVYHFQCCCQGWQNQYVWSVNLTYSYCTDL